MLPTIIHPNRCMYPTPECLTQFPTTTTTTTNTSSSIAFIGVVLNLSKHGIGVIAGGQILLETPSSLDQPYSRGWRLLCACDESPQSVGDDEEPDSSAVQAMPGGAHMVWPYPTDSQTPGLSLNVVFVKFPLTTGALREPQHPSEASAVPSAAAGERDT